MEKHRKEILIEVQLQVALKIKIMNKLQTVNEHTIIRETIGYNALKDMEVCNLSEVIEFLKIVYNYQKMRKIKLS